MLVTVVDLELFRAALRRNGVWFVDAHLSMPTEFFHSCCFSRNLQPTVGEVA